MYELMSQIAGYQSTVAQLQIALEDAVEHAALRSICGVSSSGFGTACFCQDIRKLVPHLPVATILRYISSFVCEYVDVHTQTEQSALTSAQETRISDLTEISIQTDPIAPCTRGTQTSPGDIPRPRQTFSRTEEWSNKSLVTQIMPKFSKTPNYDSMASYSTPPIRPATPPHIPSNTLLDDPLETENPTKLDGHAKLISETLNSRQVTQDPINGCTVINGLKHASDNDGDYSVIMSDRSAESLGYTRNPMHLTNNNSSQTTIYTDNHIKTRESARLSTSLPDESDAQKALEDSFHEASTKLSDDKTNDQIISSCAETRPSTAGKSETLSRQRGENTSQRDLNSICTYSNPTAMPDHTSTGEKKNKLAALTQISSAVNEPAGLLKSAALIWSSCGADKYPISIETTSATPQKTRKKGPNKKPPTNGVGNNREWVQKNSKVSGELNSNKKGVSIGCSPPQPCASVSGLEGGGTQEDSASLEKMLELEKEFVIERGCSRSRLKKPSARLRVVNDDYGFADDPEMVAIFREFEAQLNHQKSLKRRKCVHVPP